MAIFKSQLVTSASGSVGGVTFSRNRSGMYMRARAMPTNPSSARQQVVRNATSLLSQRWVDTLNEEQREGWTHYAASVAMKNALGDVHHLSGLPMYVRCNVPRLQANMPGLLDVSDDAPTIFTLGEAVEGGFLEQASATPFGITFQWNTPLTATDFVLIYVSQAQNPTINYFKGPFRFQSAPNGTEEPQTLSPNPTWVADQKIFARVRVAYADGRLSSASDYSLTLTNTPV